MSDNTYSATCQNSLRSGSNEYKAKLRAFSSDGTKGDEVTIDYNRTESLLLPGPTGNLFKLEYRSEDPSSWIDARCFGPVNDGDEINLLFDGGVAVLINQQAVLRQDCPD